MDKKSSDNVKIRCSDILRLWSRGGDSGAPVFKLRGLTTGIEVFLVGIMWGGPVGDYSTTYISALDQIRKDLGQFHTYPRSPPQITSIEGPRNPPLPIFRKCRWYAHVAWEGTGPVEYEWSGVISGTGNPLISRPPRGSGWLTVEVTDLLDQSDRDSIYITAGGPRDNEHCWITLFPDSTQQRR